MKNKSKTKPKARVYRHLVSLTGLVVLLMLLPLLLLLPAGLIWLWEMGWVYWWLGAGAGLTLLGYLLALWLRRRIKAGPSEADIGVARDDDEAVTPPSETWSPQDLEAWQEVQRLARETDRNILGSQTLLLQRARTVIEAVARHYYPEHRDPVWNFTLPEALLLSERVSLRLRLVLEARVPGAHLFHAGQVMRLWRVRSHGMKYYRGARFAFRILRLVNPVSALLAEARERIFDVAFDDTSQTLRQKGARIWVEEVGRASIDLYSGRLRADPVQLAQLAESESRFRPPPGPIQVLVAGQVNTGKSSLVNTLTRETQAAVDVMPMTENSERYQLTIDGEPQAILIDSPGVSRNKGRDWWGERCAGVDCILWVVAAHRADRDLDRQSLESIRDWFRGNPQRSMPPVLLVVSHIDRLSPAREWSPPYDLATRTRPKAAAIGEALDQIAQDLDLRDSELVPVRLDPGGEGYNVDLLWGLLEEHLETAKQGRAQRLGLMARGRDWKKLLRQARGAGRFITGALRR